MIWQNGKNIKLIIEMQIYIFSVKSERKCQKNIKLFTFLAKSFVGTFAFITFEVGFWKYPTSAHD